MLEPSATLRSPELRASFRCQAVRAVSGLSVELSDAPVDAAGVNCRSRRRVCRVPALLNGVPVRVLMTVTFRFSLGDRDL